MELQTILVAPHPCGTSPWIDPIFGPTVANEHYWSSTSRADIPNDAWEVLFANGSVDDASKNILLPARAVRGGL